MSETLRIVRADAKKKTAQDALGTTIGTWDDLQVYLISSSRMMKEVVSASTISESFRKIEEGVDAAVPVDAQNAPTRDLENCRQFSTAPTPISCFLERRTKNKERTTKQRS